MDRIELASQLISKGVELLDESYGAHGVYEKIGEEKYKKEKTKNDEFDSKHSFFKSPRIKEQLIKNRLDYHSKMRNDRDIPLEKRQEYTKMVADSFNRSNDVISDARKSQRKANADANNARMKNSNAEPKTFIASLLTEAAYLLSLVDNDDE